MSQRLLSENLLLFHGFVPEPVPVHEVSQCFKNMSQGHVGLYFSSVVMKQYN